MRLLSMSVDFFQEKVMDFYQRAGREALPWRRKDISAYEVWVSEIMLQQTQVSRVIGYYTRFLERFPTVDNLAKADWEVFLPYYVGLGYYARGRNMLRTARVIVNEYGGEFPREKELLMRLPGVGEYTASAILSFAYGANHLAWDTNLRRVTGRFFFGTKRAFEGSGQARQKRIAATFSSRNTRAFNSALMDFGSAVCVGRPKCGNCPLSKQCVYFRQKGRQERKAETGKAVFPIKDARVLLWLHEDHKRYFSPYKTKFRPFAIPPAYNTRTGIKQWFRERYSLELSVRPPHKKAYISGKPVLFINAQILHGTPVFSVFAPLVVKEYNEGISIG